MISALKAEFRKLFTVRSTYVITGLAFLAIGFVSFYAEGLKGGAISGPNANLYLVSSITQHSAVISLLGALVALLLLTHEYRYNTITYTLAAANSRSKVLLAKIVAVFVYIFGFAVVSGIVGLICITMGMAIAGHVLPQQDISFVTYLGKMVFYCEGWALAALLFAALFRNQVAVIAILLIGPNTTEVLLSLFLKNRAVYLPFTALSQVIAPPSASGFSGLAANTTLSPMRGAFVFCVYLVVGWAVTWLLFMKRDAS
ncbi:MAG: ABC transporter permease [Candidatus Micrarchaeaceae archaeon]